MKLFLRTLLALTALSVAFLGTARAQIVTYETVSAWTGSVSTFGAGRTLGEVYTNLNGVYSITYTFASAATGTASAAGSLNAVWGEWSYGTKAFVSGTTYSFGTVSIPSSSSWTKTVDVEGTLYPVYDATFAFSTWRVVDPTKTYALMLTNPGAKTSFALGTTDIFTDSFAFGELFTGASYSGGSGQDYAFSSMILVPGGNIIPEASTTAAFSACGLVGFLAVLRRRQRQKQAVQIAA